LIDFWRQQTGALSEATKALFEWNAGLSKVSPEFVRSSMGAVSEEATKATTKIGELTQYFKLMEQQMLFSTGSVGYFIDMISRSGAAAERSYYEQKLAAEALEAQIKKVGVSEVTRFGTTTAAAQSLTKEVEKEIGALWLLNDQDLDQLRSAMNDANDKLREMQEETQSAKDRLAELNAELLEAQGQDQKAELLRQQLDYQQQLAEIEKQRQEAEQSGNREILAILNNQQAVLEKINRTKIANIEADVGDDKATTRMNELAAAAERAGSALKEVSQVDLNPINTQAIQLAKSFSDLDGVL
jgi:chromosome segregation ATPase